MKAMLTEFSCDQVRKWDYSLKVELHLLTEDEDVGLHLHYRNEALLTVLSTRCFLLGSQVPNHTPRQAGDRDS